MLVFKVSVYLGVLVMFAAGASLDESSGEEPGLDWDENPDYVESSVRLCPGMDEGLQEVKKELKDLRASIDGLRTLFDPEFKVEPKIEIPSKRCPHGFHYLPKAGSCYRVIYEEHNWTSADERCRSMKAGAHLVAITTKKENEALVKYLEWDLNTNSHKDLCKFRDWRDPQKMLWTAGHRTNDSCHQPFVWQLSPGEDQQMSFHHWAVHEPNCAGENEKCLHIRPSGSYKWNDIKCERIMCPVCEFDLQNN